MSAAVTRSEKLEHSTNELTQEASIAGKLEARPTVEVTQVTEADRGSITDHGTTPLMRAACDGLAGTVLVLLDRGAEVNARRSDGFTALALAAFFGHSQVVWLLLENGADLAATGRSETTPEMWANARGFFDIADAIREARATELTQASSVNTVVIDESARFPRPAEKEKIQGAGDPVTSAEAAVIDEAPDSNATLSMKPAPMAEESSATRSESIVDILPTDHSELAQQQPVPERPLGAPRILPEIEDAPPLVVPKFHPGSAFVARITSSRKTLGALILVVLVACSGIALLLFPQVRKSLRERQAQAASNTSDLESNNPVAESRTSASGTVEISSAPATEPPSPPAAKGIEETPADTPTDSKRVESTSQVDSVGVSDNRSVETAAALGSESGTHPVADDRVSVTSEDKRDSAAASMSRTGTRTRKQRAVSRAVKFKEQTVAEEQPKPAPLSVETSRNRSVISTPAVNASEVPSIQSPPLGVISGKPKSKVIQWP